MCLNAEFVRIASLTSLYIFLKGFFLPVTVAQQINLPFPLSFK